LARIPVFTIEHYPWYKSPHTQQDLTASPRFHPRDATVDSTGAGIAAEFYTMNSALLITIPNPEGKA
jgi:hypothetical protein